MLATVIVALHLSCALAAPYMARSTDTPRPNDMPMAYAPLRPAPSSAWKGVSSPVTATPCPLTNEAISPTAVSRPVPTFSYVPPREAHPGPAKQDSVRRKTPCPSSRRPKYNAPKTTVQEATPFEPLVSGETKTPATASIMTPVSVPLSSSPSPQYPSPRPGSAARSEDGSTVSAEGDNTVSAAADDTSGAASSNGKDASFAAAAPGAALGLGTTLRSHLNSAPTPCAKSNPAVMSYGSAMYTATVTPSSHPYSSQPKPYSAYVDTEVGTGYTPPHKRSSGHKKRQTKPTGPYVISPSIAPKRTHRRRCNKSPKRPVSVMVYPTIGPSPQNGAPRKQDYRQNPQPVTYSPPTPVPSASGTAMYSPNAVPSPLPASTPSPVVSKPVAPSIQATIAVSPVPGSMAQSEDGSTVTAKGDNTVSIAADKDSGSAGANGEDAALAAAAPGLGLAIGTSRLLYPTSPLPVAASAPGCVGAQSTSDHSLPARGPMTNEDGAPDNSYAKVKNHVNVNKSDANRKPYVSEQAQQHDDYASTSSTDHNNHEIQVGESSYSSGLSSVNESRKKHETRVSPRKTPCAKGGTHDVLVPHTQVPVVPTYKNSGTVGVGNEVKSNSDKPEAARTTPTFSAKPSPTASPSTLSFPATKSPAPGTMAVSENGSSVNAKGDTTVSLAADTKSGSASANGKGGALAGAMPGKALGVGSSRVFNTA